MRRWPAEGRERGVLHIVHGLAEHSLRYERTALALNAQGWTVYAHDHRGHGQTAGSPANLGLFAPSGGWGRVMEDLRLLVESESANHRGIPFVLMGHSMGSFMSLSFMGRHGGRLAGCALSGGGGRPDRRFYLIRSLAHLERVRIGRRGRSRLLYALSLSTANRAFQPVRTNFDWLSRDESEVDRFTADPFCGWIGTAQLWIDLTTGAREAWSRGNLARIPKDLPVYVFSGRMDPVSDGCRQLELLLSQLQTLGLRRVSHRFYPGGRHEMLNEQNRDEVIADLAAWLDTIASPRGRTIKRVPSDLNASSDLTA